ncbi:MULTISPECIES: DUF3088 domain-containing protein [unclassified Novosphingobium]|uniref:DUF3088 domain-containing protein n=1 Tax=unclassified Novosphingobium TaxID=2644732 RepID=UPI0014462075|nr:MULTISPECIES: DUF3088 domain-containing protein [unclassified Novosphingobium]NKJ44991.1 hypothetical protein [Novosphingobium sp. SG720]NMN07363.1 hypothetical protein [Novosphingobium sp. SG919]NMN89732.1 hypothetical protein [Novosphingobium sp. SG916]
MKDTLFLMRPGFFNAGLGPFYCGDSAPVEGMLSFFPQLRETIDVVYVDFERPRLPIVALVGEAHQSVPVLVLAEGRTAPPGFAARTFTERTFIDDQADIRQYLSVLCDLPTAG